jgi:hypothetical protein
LCRRLRFGAALFAFHRGNVVTPNTHRHMVRPSFAEAARIYTPDV